MEKWSGNKFNVKNTYEKMITMDETMGINISNRIYVCF